MSKASENYTNRCVSLDMTLKYFKYLLFTIAFVSIKGCWLSNDWTEEERQAFREKCNKQKEFSPNPIIFSGFDLNGTDSILVIKKNNSTAIDTLNIYIEKNRNKWDIENSKYSGTSTKDFNVNNKYEFQIKNETPYILDSMEIVMWAQFTMGGEGWGCVMGNYYVDTNKFEHTGNIYIDKRP